MDIKKTYVKIRRYAHNTLWIMSDRFLSLGIGFAVTVILARYLGPADFGIFSYATSIVTLFAAAGHMGLSGLVVREIIIKPDERGSTIGATFGLKLLGMGAGYIILLCYGLIFEGVDSIEFAAIVIAGATLLFRPFDVLEFWFQAYIQAKYTAIARVTGVLVGAVLKLLFVFSGLGVLYIVATNLIQAIAVAMIMLVIYKLKSDLSFARWCFSWKKAKSLLGEGWQVYLGSIFSLIYLKSDQIMLRWFDGSEAVGVYAVAAQLSEAWYFIPAAIVASIFPRLIKLREESHLQFNERFQQLLDILLITGLGAAIAVNIFAEWIVSLFFGSGYAHSADILVIHIWAAVFIFMRAAFSRWILIENALAFSLITQGAGAIINVVLNFVFIPKYGALGAAYTTLISYAFASYFSLFFYRKTRAVFFMMTKSLFTPIRYAKRLSNEENA